MKRSLGLLAPLVLFVAVGCGGESSLDSILHGDQSRPTSAASDVDGSAADQEGRGDADEAEPGGPSSDDAPITTAVPPIPGDAEAYCRLARNFDEAGDEISEVLDTFTFDPDQIRVAFGQALQALGELAAVAPEEIRGDIMVFGEGFEQLLTELEAVGFNFFALDLEALEELSEGLDESAERIEEFNERVCGIPRVEFDDDFGDLEDALGELGDLFGDLGDVDMGEFGSFFTEMLVQEFLSEGYSQSEAECLAVAVLDLESFFGALAEGDSSAFEDIVDPFTRCGVAQR